MLARPSRVALFTGRLKINTFVKNSSSSMGLWETGWGKISVMTVGSFQVFINNMTLTRVLQVKADVLPKTSVFIFSV